MARMTISLPARRQATAQGLPYPWLVDEQTLDVPKCLKEVELKWPIFESAEQLLRPR